MDNELVTAALVVAVAALVLVVVIVLAARRSAARSERRFEAALDQLDAGMSSISHTLERAVERSRASMRRSVGDLALVLDLESLLERIAAEAASRARADAAAVRALGPDGASVSAAYGIEGADALLAAALGAPGSPPYRSLRLAWGYGSGTASGFRSALVVPVLEDESPTGHIVAFARAEEAFGEAELRALEELAAEAAPGLANARRFGEAELRAVTDALTGVRNRRGYDEELEREVARARRTERPLSLLLLDLDDFSQINKQFDFPGGDQVLREFAELLRRAARVTDIVCRRGGEEFAILLPETTGEEARAVDERLRLLVGTTAFSHVGTLTFCSGLVQLEPDETPESLDARASACVNRAKATPGKNRLEAELP